MMDGPRRQNGFGWRATGLHFLSPRSWRLAALASALFALLLPGTPEAGAQKRPSLVGVNLPSATFAPRNLPGALGADYFYPDENDVDYFVARGMNVVRLGFIWERLQPTLNAPFDRDEAQRLDDAVQIIVRRGATVILDPHNYARYRNEVIGSVAVPNESFADFWERLALLYRENDQVIFGLMNEPHGIDAGQWQEAAQAAITGIRRTGASNRILVPSSHWSSASRFVADGDLWQRIVDPADNFAFEVHQYVDAENTGNHPECPDPRAGVAALQSVTQWMRGHKRRAFLGEFGGSEQKECLTALAHMLEYMRQHSDIWLGWTYFAGGRGWPDGDILSIQPVSEEKRQLRLLREYLR